MLQAVGICGKFAVQRVGFQTKETHKHLFAFFELSFPLFFKTAPAVSLSDLFSLISVLLWEFSFVCFLLWAYEVCG